MVKRLEVLSQFRSPARQAGEESPLHICRKHPMKVYGHAAAAFNADAAVLLLIRVFYFTD